MDLFSKDDDVKSPNSEFYIKLDINQGYEYIEHLVDDYLQLIRFRRQLACLKKSKKDLLKLKKELAFNALIKSIKDDEKIRQRTFLKLKRLFLFEEKAWSFIEYSDFIKGFKDFNQKESLFMDVDFIDFGEINDSSFDENNDLDFTLPILVDHKISRYIKIKAKSNRRKDEFYLNAMLVYRIYTSFCQFIFGRSESPSGMTLWEESFQKIPLPLALLNTDGELLLHNKHFINLDLSGKRALSLVDREKVSIQDSVYTVLRYSVGTENKPIVFIVFFHLSYFLKSSRDEEDQKMPMTNEELGIISSSIAHELNNPLAGILVGLSLLLMEDEFSDDNKTRLNEMKEGALRCKQLVETFLGFSRLGYSKDEKQKNPERFGKVHLGVEQALNLLRFRIIESNIKFHMVYAEDSGEMKRDICLSTFAMLVYLLLGEVITGVSHESLLKGDKEVELKGIIFESPSSLSFEFLGRNISSLKLKESRLIRHLLERESFHLKLGGNKIELISF